MSPDPGTSVGEPIDLQYRSKADLVTDYLRRELQAGIPGPGERLVVSRVADRLGVSKVPVREAVTRLIGEGLLLLLPNVGPVVPEFTTHEVTETALMRVAIERLGLTTAFDHQTPQSRAAVEDVLRRMADPEADFPSLNVEFHIAMIDSTPYREVVRTARALLERAQRYRTALRVPGYLQGAHHSHEQLYDCLRDGDLDRLLAMNEAHITDAAAQLADQMSSRG